MNHYQTANGKASANNQTESKLDKSGPRFTIILTFNQKSQFLRDPSVFVYAIKFVFVNFETHLKLSTLNLTNPVCIYPQTAAAAISLPSPQRNTGMLCHVISLFSIVRD